jgi:hypothetical protein
MASLVSYHGYELEQTRLALERPARSVFFEGSDRPATRLFHTKPLRRLNNKTIALAKQ